MLRCWMFLNIFRQEQNGWYFDDEYFEMHGLKKFWVIQIQIVLKFIPSIIIPSIIKPVCLSTMGPDKILLD